MIMSVIAQLNTKKSLKLENVINVFFAHDMLQITGVLNLTLGSGDNTGCQRYHKESLMVL